MMSKKEEVAGIPPERVLAILKEKTAHFGFSAGEDDNVQIVECRLLDAGTDSLSYEYTQLFPGKMLKAVQVTIQLTPKEPGTVASLGGRLLRMEAPPGRPIEGSADVKHEITTFWT